MTNCSFIILILIVIIYIITIEYKEHIVTQPTYFKTMEDVYKYKMKDKKGLSYNDYLIENQLLLNKQVYNNNRIF